MTLVMAGIYGGDNGGVMVYTDTLLSTPSPIDEAGNLHLGEPTGLVTKCHVMPHLRMAVVCTGPLDLLATWLDTLRTVGGVDVTALKHVTTGGLQRIWTVLLDEFGDKLGQATVFHLGVTMDGRPIGYEYNSTSDFEPVEILPSSWFVRPGLILEDVGYPEQGDEWIELACRIRDEQHALDGNPSIAPVRIGGELFLTTITLNGDVQISAVHEFGEDPEPDELTRQAAHRRAAEVDAGSVVIAGFDWAGPR